VIVTRAVAGFALKLAMTERPAWIAWHGVLGTEYSHCHSIFVTGEASVGAFTTVFAIDRLRISD
jgi:hypothetical protein